MNKKSKKKPALHVVVNKECNNNCLFCMERNVAHMYIPSVEEASEVFKRARKKTDAILFTGPEPTVNKNFNQYVGLAKQLGYKTIRLITNGRRFAYYQYAKDLLDAGLTEISVSLHGSSAKTHDALTRTPNSFRESFLACKNLVKLKSLYPFVWYINFTLTKINSRDLFKFLKLVVGFRQLDGLVINFVIPQGRGMYYFNSLVDSYSDLADSFKKAITRLAQKSSSVRRVQTSISILGVPLCLLKNFESYLNGYEAILRTSRTRLQEIKKGRRHIRLKGKACQSCRYFHTCFGVWSNYLKKRDWSEFVPIQ